METRIFGVRHHGPGCAKALRRELARFEPDRLLVEGPPEGDELLALLDDDLEPPVAILCYRPDEPRQAIFFPFARFSPEWQALQYARERAVPAQFFDLPVGQRFAFIESGRSAGAAEGESLDPLAELALAAGYDDDDRFWEEWFEQRERTSGVFEAIAEAMRSVRDVPTGSAPSTRAESTWEASLESIREAQMRLRMRLAEKDGTQRLAVVCGAWHVPALERMPPQREDRARLRGLRKLKVASTFVPWTYRRLGVASGYGAGVRAPGWYDHLWRYGADAPAAWLARVGHELRRIHRDVAPASAIDALRLADALAAMRAQPRPGYRELMDAAQSVFCEGEGALLEIVERTVAVGERIGRVPERAPRCPLEEDLSRQCRRLRLTRSAAPRLLELDLRKPLHLERSRLLHRLWLLDLEWGEREEISGASGTFHENWQLSWEPELAVRLVELGAWGNTIAQAAVARVTERLRAPGDLRGLTDLLGGVLLADLDEAVGAVVQRLEEQAALSFDIPHLCLALPPLVRILRYGNVRETRRHLVREVVDAIAPRICVGIASACRFVDDAYARELFEHLEHSQSAFALLDLPHRDGWNEALRELSESANVHPLIAARALRYRIDARQLPSDEVQRRLGRALCAAQPATIAAAWFEGFFSGSGLLLVHDRSLFEILDRWLVSLGDDDFIALLPLLRRTAASFDPAERRQIFARASREGPNRAEGSPTMFDRERALCVLPLLLAIDEASRARDEARESATDDEELG